MMAAMQPAMVPRPQAPLLEIDGLSKQYEGQFALRAVDLDIRRAEVLALCGENGAGKSTLVRILTGIVPPDGGMLRFDGAEIAIRSPAAARALGIAAVHQDFDLAPNLTVAENLLLGAEPEWLPGFVDRRRARQLARERLAAVGLAVDPATPVEHLTVAQRQLVAIAKAIAAPVKLLILDEPTSSLGAADIAHLLDLVERQRANGTSVLFISHKLDEVFRVADRIGVLRDGCNAGTRDTAATTPAEIISLMVGRELQHREHRDATASSEVLLDIRGLRAPGLTALFDLALRAGEIVGLYGLKGAGRVHLLRALFGLTRMSAGEVRLCGQRLRVRSPRDAIRAGLGWVCRDRKELGLFANLDVGENLSISALSMDGVRVKTPGSALHARSSIPGFYSDPKYTGARLSRWGFIDGTAERRAISESIQRLGIRTTGARQAITSLSGGNQQKVLLARWLLCRPRVLVLDEPTAGIDVGAKSEIYALMHELSAQGIGILMVSSELPEVLALSDRVMVMHEGALRGELDRAAASEERVMQLIHVARIGVRI